MEFLLKNLNIFSKFFLLKNSKKIQEYFKNFPQNSQKNNNLASGCGLCIIFAP
jgi:hypothetical protein